MFAPTRTFAHDDILWTCTHGGCYATAGVGWGRDDDILWTCTHGGCYATAGVGWGGLGMMTFFELAHMVDATQLLGWGGVGWGWWHSLNLHTWWMLRNCWGGVGWGGVGMMTFFELEHMVDATHTWWMLRNCWGGVGWAGDDDILELAQEARLANRRCRKRIEAWGSRRKDCMIWAVPRKKGSECGTGKGQGCSEHVSVVKGFPDIQLTS